jgi:hypothetical protein
MVQCSFNYFYERGSNNRLFITRIITYSVGGVPFLNNSQYGVYVWNTVCTDFLHINHIIFSFYTTYFITKLERAQLWIRPLLSIF